MKTSQQGIESICKSEAFRGFAYPDPYSAMAVATRGKRWGFEPADQILAALPPATQKLSGKPWTVGFGQTNNVTPASCMRRDEATANLCESLPRYEKIVNDALTQEPTQGQFDALMNLAWNCPKALDPKTSSIVKAHNRGDFAAAARAFELYCMSAGKRSDSLLARRKREGSDYLAASPGVGDAGPAPQAVDAERPMSRSRVTLASSAAGGVAALSGANELLKAVADFQSGVAGLGQWVVPIALAAVVGLCAYTIWARFDMRRQGVA